MRRIVQDNGTNVKKKDRFVQIFGTIELFIMELCKNKAGLVLLKREKYVYVIYNVMYVFYAK
ncbi:hypothetical protein A9Q76_09625 [Arcobacter sp. 31_11_sub10_T18]|nr:hypothetical protein A9Q76_09625 [Arcobacter sp. 31_11_sub10_T18]